MQPDPGEMMRRLKTDVLLGLRNQAFAAVRGLHLIRMDLVDRGFVNLDDNQIDELNSIDVTLEEISYLLRELDDARTLAGQCAK